MPPRVVPSSTDPGEPGDPGDLALKISDLIKLKLKPDQTEYTRTEIAQGVSALHTETRVAEVTASLVATGASQEEIDAAVEAIRAEPPLVHRTYIGGILDGRKNNPTMVVLQALARWFGVSPSYFFPGDEGAEARKEVETLALLHELKTSGQMPQVLALTRSTGGLSPGLATGIFTMAIEAARAAGEISKEAASGDI